MQKRKKQNEKLIITTEMSWDELREITAAAEEFLNHSN